MEGLARRLEDDGIVRLTMDGREAAAALLRTLSRENAALKARLAEVEGERDEARASWKEAADGWTMAGDALAAAQVALAAADARIEALTKALEDTRAFIGVMFGRGPDAVIPETVQTPLGIPVKIGEISRAAARALSEQTPSPPAQGGS